MFRLGFAEEDVTFKAFEHFVVKDHPESTTQLRYKRHVSRVATNIKELRKQRKVYIQSKKS